MDPPARILEIKPARRQGGPAPGLAIGVMVFPQVLFLAVLALIAVYVPFFRIILAVWVLWLLAVAVLMLRALRRLRKGVVQPPSLWLTADELGFTNARGMTASCPRSAITSALRVFATIDGRTRDLLVFRDSEDNALVTAPLVTWTAEAVDKLTEQLGIPPAHRKFVNSADELEAAAHGAPTPFRVVVSPRYRGILVGVLAALVLVMVVVLALTARQ